MTAAVNHWAAGYIGMEWTPTFSCWHFCALVWRQRFGVSVSPTVVDASDPRATRRAFEAGAAAGGWATVSAPIEGDAVLMAKGARPCHVGIWLNLGGVLHCIEGVGAIFTARERLGDLGYRVVGTYRRVAA